MAMLGFLSALWLLERAWMEQSGRAMGWHFFWAAFAELADLSSA